MDARDRRAREIQQHIREVLLGWDPIGIRDEPQAQDEYDAYMGGVYRLLARSATEDELIEHLARVDPTGEPPQDLSRLRPVARQLHALDVSL